ncbi:hypothetical protein ACFW04_014672 [Cataglyphis niger]
MNICTYERKQNEIKVNHEKYNYYFYRACCVCYIVQIAAHMLLCVTRNIRGGNKHSCTKLQATTNYSRIYFHAATTDLPILAVACRTGVNLPLHVCDTSNKRHSIPRIFYAIVNVCVLPNLYFFLFITANLTDNESQKVDMTHFNILENIDSGAYGKVYLVQKLVGIDAGKLYAMKVLKKEKIVEKKKTMAERNIRDSPFLTTIHYAFQTNKRLSTSRINKFNYIYNLIIYRYYKFNYIYNLIIYRYYIFTNLTLHKTHFYVGVLTYKLLTDSSPFSLDGKNNQQEISKRILTSNSPSKPIHLNPRRKLGDGPGDAKELKHHPFFMDPTSNFLDEFTKGPVTHMTPPIIKDNKIEWHSSNYSYVGSFILSINDKVSRGIFSDKQQPSLAIRSVHAFQRATVASRLSAMSTSQYSGVCREDYQQENRQQPRGELATRLSASRECSEADRSSSRSASHIYRNGIAHGRSQRQRPFPELKVKETMKNNCELLPTPYCMFPYAASEIIAKQGYDESYDMWSLDTILYFMLSRDSSFPANPSHLANRIKKGEIDFDSEAWSHVSAAAVQVLKGLRSTILPPAAAIVNANYVDYAVAGSSTSSTTEREGFRGWRYQADSTAMVSITNNTFTSSLSVIDFSEEAINEYLISSLSEEIFLTFGHARFSKSGL